jgi:dolichol kinase
VHSVPEVGAGIALAVFSLAVVERFSLAQPILLSGAKVEKNLYMAGRAPDERSRKLVQMLLGLAVFAFALFFGTSQAVLPVLYLFCCGLLLFHMKSHNVMVPFVDRLLAWLERPRAPAGYGALTFFAGILLSLCLIPQQEMALSAVYVLAISDSAATFAGSRGTHYLPYNSKKTVEGTCAFFLSALPVYFIGGAPALLMAALAAIIESLPIGLDDNLLIPWAGVLLSAIRI